MMCLESFNMFAFFTIFSLSSTNEVVLCGEKNDQNGLMRFDFGHACLHKKTSIYCGLMLKDNMWHVEHTK